MITLITPSSGEMNLQLREGVGLSTQMVLDEGARLARSFGLLIPCDGVPRGRPEVDPIWRKLHGPCQTACPRKCAGFGPSIDQPWHLEAAS